MATSKHLQLRASVAAALASVAGGRVYQNRAFNLATGVDSQVHVNFSGADPDNEVMYANHPMDWTTTINLVILARKVGSVEATDVADAVWVDAYAALMADQALGGAADYLEPGSVSVDEAEADASTARIDWSITVRHRTANNSIS